jgi:phosphatidylglycerol:prolipoprotein diacylglycerol transferase
MALEFPNIDPVFLSIGPLKVHWYGISYIIGIVMAWHWGNRLLKKFPFAITAKIFDDFLPYVVVGIIIGGRLGHVIFYEPLRYLNNPLEIFMVWKGGMSFHGGLIGVVSMAIYYSKLHKINFYSSADLMALIAPIGLFFGRIANFINAELFGTPTDKPWGVIFPGQSIARHPTQIYEALFEGALLFVILNIAYASNAKLRLNKGVTGCFFLVLYSLFRLFIETFKVQSVELTFMGVTFGAGVVLCMLMLLIGIHLLIARLLDCASSSKKMAP